MNQAILDKIRKVEPYVPGEKKTEIGYIFILYTDFYFFFIFYSFILANFAL